MKLIDDTLKTPNGKWDKQALTYFATALITFAVGVALVVFSYALGVTSNPTAETVFITFAGLTGALSGVDIWQIKVKRKSDLNNQSDNYENQG